MTETSIKVYQIQTQPVDALTAAVRFCFHDLFGEYATTQKNPYVYKANPVRMSPYSRHTTIVKIHADARFVAFSIAAIATNPSSLRLIMRNDASDCMNMNMPIEMDIFGNGQFMFPTPLEMMPNSTTSIDIDNETDSPEQNIVVIAFIGMKVYNVTYRGGQKAPPERPAPAVDHVGLERLKVFLDELARTYGITP